MVAGVGRFHRLFSDGSEIVNSHSVSDVGVFMNDHMMADLTIRPNNDALFNDAIFPYQRTFSYRSGRVDDTGHYNLSKWSLSTSRVRYRVSNTSFALSTIKWGSYTE